MIKRKNLRNNSGQALVEYVLVVALMVTALAWGFNILKCRLHGLWVTMACDIFYPYPAKGVGELKDKICDTNAVNCKKNSEPI